MIWSAWHTSSCWGLHHFTRHEKPPHVSDMARCDFAYSQVPVLATSAPSAVSMQLTISGTSKGADAA